MMKCSHNTILLLFNDLLPAGGIQEYNRNLDKTLKLEFTEYSFRRIVLADLGKLKFIFNVILSIWREPPRFIICSHINLVPFVLMIQLCLNIDYVLLTHGIEVWQVKKGIKFYGLHKALFILTVSKYSKNKLVANKIDGTKIKILSNTIDTYLFRPKPKNRKLLDTLKAEGKRILLTVARLSKKEKYKGHDIVLEVLQDLGNDYLWVVAGEGDDLHRIKQKARELGVIEKVCFVGKVSKDHLVDYYNLCDVFIMPSKGEGFGIVFLEALACGKPVIAGNTDGSGEPLLDGKLGFLVNPESRQDIFEAINTINKGKSQKTAPLYLRSKVEENFGLPLFRKKVKDIFSQLLP